MTNKTKFLRISMMSVLLVLVLGFTAMAETTSITVIIDADSEKISFTAKTVWLEIFRGEAGEAIFVCDEVQWLNHTGAPHIPWKVLMVLLPPDVKFSSMSANLTQAKFEPVEGTWTVRPTSPWMRWKNGERIVIWPEDKNIVDGYDVDIYTCDALWPEAKVRILNKGRLRKWRLAQVAIPLVRYNPVRSELVQLTDAEVAVNFDRVAVGKTVLTEAELSDWIGRSRVQEIAINFEQFCDDYGVSAGGAKACSGGGGGGKGGGSTPGYVIITTSDINDASPDLADFVSHKESLGFDVKVITNDPSGDPNSNFEGGTGDTAAENIRDWLKDHYVSEAIEYVLLIGDPCTSLGEVPMKRMYYCDYVWSGTDYYYADLTGNWDLDNDANYGEWDDDFGEGGVDRNWEVLVGRIPYYDSLSDMNSILKRTISYETQTSAQALWRKNVLIAIPGDSEHAMGEAIVDNLLDPNGWGYGVNPMYYRIYYDDYNLDPPPKKTPCCYDNVTDVWNGDIWNHEGKYGLVVWLSHGSEDATTALGVMKNSYVSELNDDYPSFIFAASCFLARPDISNNLTYELLKHGGICTIGATHTAWGSANEVVGEPTLVGMCYEYTSRLVIVRKTSGYALNDLKQTIDPSQKEGWANYTRFNIYGDPALCPYPFEYNNERGFRVENNSNETVAWSDSAGNFYLKGTLEEESDHIATGNDEFRIQDSSGNDVAIIDSTNGNMYIGGVLSEYQTQGGLELGRGNYFFIKNDDDAITARLGDGALVLAGKLFEEAEQ